MSDTEIIKNAANGQATKVSELVHEKMRQESLRVLSQLETETINKYFVKEDEDEDEDKDEDNDSDSEDEDNDSDSEDEDDD